MGNKIFTEELRRRDEKLLEGGHVCAFFYHDLAWDDEGREVPFNLRCDCGLTPLDALQARRRASEQGGRSSQYTIPMPLGIEMYNGRNEPCEALQGPCSCGATHRLADWQLTLKR